MTRLMKKRIHWSLKRKAIVVDEWYVLHVKNKSVCRSLDRETKEWWQLFRTIESEMKWNGIFLLLTMIIN